MMVDTYEKCNINLFLNKLQWHPFRSFAGFAGHTAKADIQSDTSGDFRNILSNLLTVIFAVEKCLIYIKFYFKAHRDDESTPVDAELAKTDAKRLYDAGPGRLGTTESVFYEIFMHRSWPQLHATVQHYDQTYKKPMKSMIKSEFSGHASDALNTLGTLFVNAIIY